MIKIVLERIKEVYLWINDHTVLIAIVAVIIAWLPFYYQYLRKTNDAKAVILNFLVGNAPESQFISEIVFINNGNQPCSIVRVEALFRNIDTDEPIRKGISRVPCINQTPFTLAPNAVVTKQYLFGQGEPKDIDYNSRYGESNERLNFGLAISAIDSYGRFHEVETAICYLEIGKGARHYPNNFPLRVAIMPSECKQNYRGFFPLRNSQNKEDNFIGK